MRARAIVQGAVLVLTAVAGGAGPAQAQGRNGILWSNTPVITLTTPGAQEFDAGVITAKRTAMLLVVPMVKRDYTIYVRTNDTELGHGKPIADLQWRYADGGGWTSLTNTNQIVLTRSRPGVVKVEFRALVSWSDRPGNYKGDVVFELAFS